MNTKQKYFFKSREAFFRKSSFCTLADLNHGFGGPWDIFWKFLINVTFVMLLAKKIWNSCKGSKVPFCQMWKIAIMALLNPCMKVKIFFLAKSILLKHYESDINQKFPKNVPRSAKSMIKVSQSTKRGFPKKGLTGFEKLFLFCVRMNPSNT